MMESRKQRNEVVIVTPEHLAHDNAAKPGASLINTKRQFITMRTIFYPLRSNTREIEEE